MQKGDLLILFDSAPFEEEIRRNQALLAQAEAELAKAREDLKLQGLQNREELLAAQLRVEKSELELKDVQQGKGRVKEDEVQQAVANAQRELQKAETALDDLRPLLAEGFITRTELERAEQQVASSREELQLAERRRDALAGLRPAARAQPGALRRAVEPRDAAAARERRVLSRRAEAGGDRRGAEPHPGGRRAARAREAAARALRGARRGARDRGLQGRLLRLGAEEAPGRRPGLGQPAARDPARHLEDGGRDARARDRRAQGRAQPEGRGARRGLPRPAPHRHGDARGHARAGGEGAARDEVLLRAGPDPGERAAAAARHDGARRDRGRGAPTGALRPARGRLREGRAQRRATWRAEGRVRARSCSAPRTRTSW